VVEIVVQDGVDVGFPSYEKLESYYEGSNRLDALGVSLPPQVRVLEFSVNWCRVAVDAYVNRLDVEGFKITGHESVEEWLRDCWQANNLDSRHVSLHTEALVQSVAYAVVGGADPLTGFPTVSYHTRKEIDAVIDPRTKNVLHAKHNFTVGDEKYRVTYDPERIVAEKQDGEKWVKHSEMANPIGVTPVVAFINRPRVGTTRGVSELQDLMGIVDAAARTLTGGQVAQELLATPQRWVAGISGGEMFDADGNPTSVFKAYMGAILQIENENARLGQFPGADLRNFTDMLWGYARLASSVTGLPAVEFGVNTDNPPSAEGLRASYEVAIKKAERMQAVFGESHERVMHLAYLWAAAEGTLKVPTGSQVPLHRLETLWRDAGTPTLSSIADAVVKMVQGGVIQPPVARMMIPTLTPELRAMADELDTGTPIEERLGL
jgi:hypothetical protein